MATCVNGFSGVFTPAMDATDRITTTLSRYPPRGLSVDSLAQLFGMVYCYCISCLRVNLLTPALHPVDNSSDCIQTLSVTQTIHPSRGETEAGQPPSATASPTSRDRYLSHQSSQISDNDDTAEEWLFRVAHPIHGLPWHHLLCPFGSVVISDIDFISPANVNVMLRCLGIRTLHSTRSLRRIHDDGVFC